MEEVLPLVKKYGAAVVALTLDEGGIPDSAEGRVRIAEKIIRRAADYGVPKKDIIVDPLAMTVSTGGDNAKIALKALSILRGRVGVQTVLGVSNISFGLPGREKLNSAFFAMALYAGLSAGIINPFSAAMMDTYVAFCAGMGLDKDCGEYIRRFGGEQERAKAPAAAEMTLPDAIRRGLQEEAYAAARKMAETTDCLEIINSCLIPALDLVGKGFGEGTVFLPQLLMSADAAKRAFDAVKEHMASSGAQREKKGKIVLATVKGDIHDIGKNIVKTLLENYGYDVIDLGKDVPPERVVEAALQEKAPIVGLSALMTTTVSSMEQTIRLLREKTDCKVVVGGAVLNQEYADAIGADFYSKDAMCTVRFANEFFKD